MKKFDNELAAINGRLIEMADLAQRMVTLSMGAIEDRRKDVHSEVRELEKQLDQMQTEIDQDAIRLLTVYGPVAKDLRYLLVVMRITAQLERMGDQVVNVCESLDLMQSDTDYRTLPNLRKMAELVNEMVSDSIDAFFNRDPVKAAVTRTHDDVVDSLEEQVAKQVLSDEVLHGVLKGTEDIADGVAQILLARHLERIADQAVNVCKEVIYMVKGDDVRHIQGSGGDA